MNWVSILGWLLVFDADPANAFEILGRVRIEAVACSECGRAPEHAPWFSKRAEKVL